MNQFYFEDATKEQLITICLYEDCPLVETEVPDWVIEAWDVCKGCGQEFYNGRENFNGECWCWHLRPEYAGMERKPKCYKAREFVI